MQGPAMTAPEKITGGGGGYSCQSADSERCPESLQTIPIVLPKKSLKKVPDFMKFQRWMEI